MKVLSFSVCLLIIFGVMKSCAQTPDESDITNNQEKNTVKKLITFSMTK